MKVMVKDGSIVEFECVIDVFVMLANEEAGGDVARVHYNTISKEFSVPANDGDYDYRRVVAVVCTCDYCGTQTSESDDGVCDSCAEAMMVDMVEVDAIINELDENGDW